MSHRLPESVHSALRAALDAVAPGSGGLRDTLPVSGGCINSGARVRTERGDLFFLKWNAGAPPGMFAAEADGLEALRGCPSLRAPEPLAFQDRDADHPVGWLLMEYLPAGEAPPSGFGAALGRGLADLHALGGQASGQRPWGWERDNYIGSLPQDNHADAGWGDFWVLRRLQPQLELARKRGFFRDSDGDLWDRLMHRIPGFLAGTPTAALLHGDLWSGNVYGSPSGEPTVIDPAVYRGHGEVDLAMSELFGGFPDGFLEAYEDEAGVPEEYGAFRRDLYQLYPLLVHVNLFGESYAAGTLDRVRRLVEA